MRSEMNWKKVLGQIYNPNFVHDIFSSSKNRVRDTLCFNMLLRLLLQYIAITNTFLYYI